MNSGKLHGPDYWNSHINQVHRSILEDLEAGKYTLEDTRNWDYNWINIALALNKILALKMLLQTCELEEDLTLKEQIALIMLLQELNNEK